MTNGDEDPADANEEAAADEAAEDLDVESLEERLDEIASTLEEAETEADLDQVEDTLDTIADDLERADLPSPEDEEEDDPQTALEDRIETLRGDLEAARGPYAADVVASIETHATTIQDTRWTESGKKDVTTAVQTFVSAVADELKTEFTTPSGDPAAHTEALEPVGATIEDADLDPDEDTETIEALVSAVNTLESDLEAAQEWDDLDTRGQLRAEGFYEALGDKHKDFPPEWTALKSWEAEDNAEMILLAYETFDSDFMERHCLEALDRMGNTAAIDPMLEQAERRDKDAIRILGSIGHPRDDVVDTLSEYLGTDSDPDLERVTMRALGEMGARDVVPAIANRLLADAESVRSAAARSLGLIGDPRAIKPLKDVLEDDPDDSVRASAVWALLQIGTEAALQSAAEHTDDRAYVVQSEAEQAAEALEETAAAT